MTSEKALNVIKTWIGPMRKSNAGNDFANEFIDAAWYLAEKQMAKPANTFNLYRNEKFSRRIICCPECNREFETNKYKYCPDCSKKIDWSKF